MVLFTVSEILYSELSYLEISLWIPGETSGMRYLTLINPLRDDGETSLLTKQPE